MSQIYDYPEDVLRASLGKTEIAIVVLTAVSGGTLRSPGALMAVTPSEVFGYISNGCVDADIVAHARAGQSGTFIYGDGSPYRDIILPCGGCLQVTIVQSPDMSYLADTLRDLEQRNVAVLTLDECSIALVPRLRLRLAGRGEACLALAELAQRGGFDVTVQSPDEDIMSGYIHLKNPNNPPNITDDSRTAFVCLFHDHNWESGLLKQALSGSAFYVGAMGSARTHQIRCQKLIEMGVSDDDISRIKAPVGLVASQRNARFLAVSILAEILDEAKRAELI